MGMLLLGLCQPSNAMSDMDEDILSGLFYQDNDMELPTGLDANVITRAGGGATSVPFLTSLGLQDLLKTPLYLRTNPIMRVPLLDLPMFQKFVNYHKPGNQFEVFPFYTQTYEENFYKNHTHIDSYIDLRNPNFMSTLDAAVTPLGLDINIPQILPLFYNLKLQERRTGFMPQYIKNFDTWSFLVRVPVYYQEHNLYLTPEEQEAINNNPLFQQSAGEDYMQFARQHLICDALGVGDTRLMFEFFVYDHPTYQWGCGLRLTLPTGFTFKKGLYGSAFPKDKAAPNLDISDIVTTEFLETGQLTSQQTQEVVNFSESVLDRLSTILLNQPMGNGHHLGIGIFSHAHMRFSSWISLGSLTQIEILMPCGTSRFFYLGPDIAAYNAFDWSEAGQNTQIPEKLKYFNTQLQKKFFPPLYSCMVFPGLILQNTTALLFEGEFWNKTIGSDLWFQTPEHVWDVQVPAQAAPFLDVDKSKMGGGYQAKIWGSLERNAKVQSYWIRNEDETRTRLMELSPWTFGLRGEVASNSYTVGGDWGISVYIKNEF